MDHQSLVTRDPRWPDKIALCLSGGGYRAALFHLGAVRRLNELGLLSRLDVISSVSGGSIMSAHLAIALRPWPVSGTVVDRSVFDATIAGPFREFCSRNIRTAPILQRMLPWNWLRPDTAVRALAETYHDHLNHLELRELGQRPRFVFCASDMIFGVNWVFDSSDPLSTPPAARMGDYRVGFDSAGDWPVSMAVAASSCFPPVFNPLQLGLDPRKYVPGRSGYRGSDRDELVRGVSLSDGGVYDNLGSQPVLENYGVVLVSDGGAVFEEIQPLGRFALLKRLMRYSAIAQRGGSAMRTRVIVDAFVSGKRRGSYWGIGTPPSRYDRRSDECYPDDLVDDVIEEVRTDLDLFETAEQAVLENHGYLQADAAARTHLSKYDTLVPDPLPLTQVPHRDWLHPEKVKAALADSHKRRLPFGRR